MKKNIRFIVFLLFVLLLICTKKANASTGSTIFMGEPILLDDYSDIEITYNNVEINEEKSEIKNIQLYTNLSDKLITRKASIKLEDSYSNLTINSLKILVNDLEIQEITKEKDNYIFYFQINPNEGKKIEISYKTDSNLQDAKIIKYTMDKLKGKNVKLFDIKVSLSKYDIPLVQKIWPGAYEFEGNTVSTEYVDFTVNNLTSTFIMQKETYKNLKYGDYIETYSDVDKYIINHAKEIIDNGFEIKYNRVNNIMVSDNETIKELTGALEEYPYISNSTAKSIYYYKKAQIMEEKRIQDDSELYNKTDYCLTNQEIGKNKKEIHKEYNKKVAINYYETEQGKELYVYKSLNKDWENADKQYIKKDEYSILRTNTGFGKSRIYPARIFKEVYVNSDIDGNKIDITEKEILDFVNMMNIDLYVRRIIYDPRNEDEKIQGGYYTEQTKKIAENYIFGATRQYINSSLETIKETYERIKDIEWYNNMKKNYEEALNNLVSTTYYTKFNNKDVEENIKTPIVAHCVGKCIDNKIKFEETSYEDGLEDIYDAVECDIAKKMLETNKKDNESKKNKISMQISNTKIISDIEEYVPKQEEIIENNNTNNSFKLIEGLENNDIIILGSILGTVILLFIILIIVMIKNKRGYK